MSLNTESKIKISASFLILALFVYGVGEITFFPSLRLLQDTHWNTSLLMPLWGKKIFALLLLVPIFIGFGGWIRVWRDLILGGLERGTSRLMGMGITLSLFSLYLLGLGINQILVWPLVTLFFIPFWTKGLSEIWEYQKELSKFRGQSWTFFLLGIPLVLWAFEYLSPPLIWDAVLDHFRYAREVSRMHMVPFLWVNHTGDMPKWAELVFAGFWTIGGESLSKLSSAIAALLTAYLIVQFSRESKTSGREAQWIFWTCPFFLAVFSWGYVEGFLAFYELLAVFCFWKSLESIEYKPWLYMASFFMGTAFAIKYTAILMAVALMIAWIMEVIIRKRGLRIDVSCFALFLVPIFPWLLKEWVAYGNPVYPLGTGFFPSPIGYNAILGKALWRDTGIPQTLGFKSILSNLWNVFFTPGNAVNACWTPLVFMAIPWSWKATKNRLGSYYLIVGTVFFVGWALTCSNLRHGTGGALILLLLSAMIWQSVLQEKSLGPKILFVLGALISIWLCLTAQWTSTAPYASALGMEDNQERLKKNYSFDLDTFAAYREIELVSTPEDRVMAFGVFQTYPLQRSAFVDFFWKQPVFLEWASKCQTAQELATLLKENGVSYFLYQRGEAINAGFIEKNFQLTGISEIEYVHFWQHYAIPIAVFENSTVYRFVSNPSNRTENLIDLPGLEEKPLGESESLLFHGQVNQGYGVVSNLVQKYPTVASLWETKSLVEARMGLFTMGLESAQRAACLGLESMELCDTMEQCSRQLGLKKNFVYWMNTKKLLNTQYSLKVDEALRFYRGLE